MTDFSHFQGTRAVSDAQKFDVEALAAWMAQHVEGFAGPLTVEQFKGGQSNPTFKLITPGQTYVMRAKPGPKAKLLPSAHAIEREFRVQKTLGGTGVPVAKMYALCEDESVIGRAFYIMECVQGRVLWEQSLPGMDNAERAAIYDEMNRVIAALHKVDVNAIGLADYGKPGNYFARQIERWSKQYKLSETESIPAMDNLIEWLPAHMPAELNEGEQAAMSSIVHGDYRLDNLILHPTEPKVLAILDWELSTLGHPLADFSYHCMSWHIAPGEFRGIAGVDFVGLGIPLEEDYIARYLSRTGYRIAGDWNFYLAYNMFRIAGILQGIMKRVVDGTASSAQATEAGKRAKPMAELGWKYAQLAKQ
ncbi:MAG: phosphotransferase [Candidatus Protistobacter heckmanni]|nr:phosphotransferase [Candidatus Protistobacter heckmanni]